jgi:hypothetical protein
MAQGNNVPQRPQVNQTATASAPARELTLQPDAVSTEATGDQGPARRVRRPFGTQVQKLAYPQRPGYHRHWFNETPGRIQRAEEAGYNKVLGDDGKPVCRVGGTREGGGGLNVYLMEIPQEYYEEDQAAKQSRVDEVDSAIKHGGIQGTVGQDGRYIPASGIKVTR